MKPESSSSENEITCRAREYEFERGGAKMRHGVISYYAASTLPCATSAQEWLDLIATASAGDVARGALPPSHLPALQITGDPASALPGVAALAP
jgi:hypothetical protein